MLFHVVILSGVKNDSSKQGFKFDDVLEVIWTMKFRSTFIKMGGDIGVYRRGNT